MDCKQQLRTEVVQEISNFLVLFTLELLQGCLKKIPPETMILEILSWCSLHICHFIDIDSQVLNKQMDCKRQL